MASETLSDLIYGGFFFIDIVGLSNPKLSTQTQRTKIQILNRTIYNCKTFQATSKDDLFILPTGDGMLLCFKNGLEQPLNLAIEFHEKLAGYNKKASEIEKIETRIGCNIGYVFVVKDIYGNINLWGPGAILARRVMDMGDANHILLSNDLANDLFEISNDYEKSLHLLQNFGIKHGDNLLIYSAFGNGFGNPKTPKEKIKLTSKISDTPKNTKCEKMIFNIILKEKGKPARFERYFYFSNKSSEPIYEITTGIVTNSEEHFKNLELKAFDELNNELEISKILDSTSFSKKIVVKLTNPVFDGDSGKMVKISYNSKILHNNFENFFLIDTSNFELIFNHFANLDLTPRLFYFANEKGTKNTIDQLSKTTKGMFTNIKWEKPSGIKIKDMIRLEW